MTFDGFLDDNWFIPHTKHQTNEAEPHANRLLLSSAD